VELPYQKPRDRKKEVDVNFEGFQAWQSGEFIQDALPELSTDERELLISGICPKCWDVMFPSDED
jgi:hypothetical protein